MPTGYTADIYEGKDVTFAEFAWGCARAMGALLPLREAPAGTPIPERFEPQTDYYERGIAEAESRLAYLRGLTPEDVLAAALTDYKERVARARERNRKNAELAARYTAMLEQVQAWEPPTPEHQGFKAFMMEQLTTARDFDCHTIPDPPIVSAEQWYADELALANRSLDYCRDNLRREIERTQERNAWMTALRESLG